MLKKKERSVSEFEKLNKRTRHRRITAIISLVLILAILGAAIFAGLCIICKAETVTIDNYSVYDTQMLYAEFEKYIDTSLPLLDGEADIKRIVKDFPYVKNVEMKPVYPHKIEIVIYGTNDEFAVYTDEGKYVCVDSDLKVLREENEIPNELIIVEGMILPEYSVGEYIKDDGKSAVSLSVVTDILRFAEENDIFESITRIDMSKIYNIKISLLDNVFIELGNSQNLDKKIKLAYQILDDNPGAQNAVIDVHNIEKGRYGPLE